MNGEVTSFSEASMIEPQTPTPSITTTLSTPLTPKTDDIYKPEDSKFHFETMISSPETDSSSSNICTCIMHSDFNSNSNKVNLLLLNK